MSFLTTHILLKASFEVFLGVCIKLQCDNGRVHWRDLVNDLFFWVPGVEARDDDGLSRQIADQGNTTEELDLVPVLAK